MNLEVIIALSAIAGSVLTKVLDIFYKYLSGASSREASNVTTKADIINALQSQNTILLERNTEYINKIEEYGNIILDLKDKINGLENNILLLESAHQDLPIPMWLKDFKGNMLSVNLAYETIFLKPIGKERKDYVGKSDYDIWPKEIAEVFMKNDILIRRKREPRLITENIPDAMGKLIEWNILKYPRMSGNQLIGIAGIAIPKNFDQWKPFMLQ